VNHPLVQFLIFGLAMMGFFILAKMFASKLPDDGFGGDIKKVMLTA